MRILPGTPKEFANETPTSKHMSKYLISAPELLPSVMTLFDEQISAFTSLLARRNMFSGSLANPLNPKNKNYKIVGNRKVMWNVKGYPERKMRLVRDAVCDAYPTQLGKALSVIKLYTDSNWASPREVLELADGRSQLYIYDSMLPVMVEEGVWEYKVKVNTNDVTEYISSTLLATGMEVAPRFTQYEEMSETAYEKYTFDEKAYTHLTIQRLKWSISGTADEYKPSAVWIEHKGVKMWADHAQLQMLERAARYREYQLLFGKSTVTADDKIVMKTSEGFDVMAGDGLMNQGDGAWRLPYNKMSLQTIDRILENMALYASSYGTEVAVICGRQWYNNFANLMKQQAGIDPQVVEMEGKQKGINLDYAYYQMGGVKIIPTVVPWFDSPMRPSVTLSDGTRSNSHNAIFVSLGNVELGNPNIELLALGKRSWLEGEVNGINKGGDMANSVDGRHHHLLFETGIALKDINGIAEMYRPIV